MKTIGLATDQTVQKYLAEAEGLSLVSNIENTPLFSKGSSHFFGGYKSFYTLALDADKKQIDDILKQVVQQSRDFQPLISVPFFDKRAMLINHVLEIKDGLDPEKRFDIYEKKTRNLVRKSYKNDFILKVGAPTDSFYALYEGSIRRLGGLTKSREWFERLEKALGDKIVAFSLFDGDKLIAANYCILADEYIFLMFNASDPSYWDHAVNDRVYDELVRWAIERKIRYIDFGPSTRNDLTHSHFKEGFGAKKWHLIGGAHGGTFFKLRTFVAAKRHAVRLRWQRKRLGGMLRKQR